MRRAWWRLPALTALAVLGLCGLFGNAALAQFGPRFVKATATAPKTVTAGKPFTLTVNITVDKPYHIQANPPKKDYIPTVVQVGKVPGFKVGKVVYPKPVEAMVAGEKLPVYEGKVQVRVTLTPDKKAKPGKVTLPITVKYQGCTDKTCYPPTKVETKAVVSVAAAKKAADAAAGTLLLAQAETNAEQPGTGTSGDALSVPGFRGSKITQFMEPKPFLEWLEKGGSQAGKADVVTDLLNKGGASNFAGALGLIYLLGLALNLTPCVYPLIPITIGYFGRQAANGAKTGALSVSYAFGMAVMYSALGLLAALAGKGFGAQLSNPIVLIFFAVLMFALGLSMFDRPDGRPIWELQLPSSLTGQAKSRAGYGGAFLMGLMVGLVAAPCIGPIVVALIQVVGSTGSAPLGLATFFTLGVGLATPYLLLGFGLVKALPRAGEWMVAVKRIFGLLLFGMGIYYLRVLLGPVIYPIVLTAFAIGSGIYLLFLDKSGKSAANFLMFKHAVGVGAIVFGIWAYAVNAPKAEANDQTAQAPGNAPAKIAFAVPSGFADFEAKLKAAQEQGKPVLIDFWATWCAACKELEEKTFKNAEVAKSTANHINLRVQLEDFETGDNAKFVKKFGIVGLPTVVHMIPDAKVQAARL